MKYLLRIAEAMGLNTDSADEQELTHRITDEWSKVMALIADYEAKALALERMGIEIDEIEV